MIKLFSLVLDLLEIQSNDAYTNLAQNIIENPDYKIISIFDKGFVFFAFQELLLKKISQEDFVALGDSFGDFWKYQINPISGKESLIYGLNNDIKSYQNSYIIVDKKDQNYIENSIKSLDSILKKIKSQIFYL